MIAVVDDILLPDTHCATGRASGLQKQSPQTQKGLLFDRINLTNSKSGELDHHTTTVLRPFFQDHPGEPVPEENFWTLWCKGRLTEADTQTIRLGATPPRLTSAHLHHPPIFYRPDAFPAAHQQCQSTEGN